MEELVPHPIKTEFSQSANFGLAEFSKKADFYSTIFSGEVEFSSAKFSGEADFSSTFKDKAFFNYVLFEDGKKILFGEIEDLSKFSFMNTDITRVRFSDRARWGKEDKIRVIEEERLENFLKFSFCWEKTTIPNSEDSTKRKDFLIQNKLEWRLTICKD